MKYGWMVLGVVAAMVVVGGCKREGEKGGGEATTRGAATAGAPATVKAAATPTAEEVKSWVADLAGDDGEKRVEATRRFFDLGAAGAKELEVAGAKQVAPFGGAGSRRMDVVYSLLERLPKNKPGAMAGYATGSFGLTLQKGCTAADVKRLGEQYGFVIEGSFSDGVPNCYVFLKRGKQLEPVLREVLSDAPEVVGVSLNYFER